MAELVWMQGQWNTISPKIILILKNLLVNIYVIEHLNFENTKKKKIFKTRGTDQRSASAEWKTFVRTQQPNNHTVRISRSNMHALTFSLLILNSLGCVRFFVSLRVCSARVQYNDFGRLLIRFNNHCFEQEQHSTRKNQLVWFYSCAQQAALFPHRWNVRRTKTKTSYNNKLQFVERMGLA